MRRRCLSVVFLFVAATGCAHATTYHVDCNADAKDAAILHTIDAVNTLPLQYGDEVLFRRGTVCHGSLHPQGNGVWMHAEGTGPLPRIEAGSKDEAAFSLFNQEAWQVESLDLRGGTTYGIRISGDHGVMHKIDLINLTVSGVRGPLKKKESGLVVIVPDGDDATFEDVVVDRVRAYGTTQWAGIFIAGGSLQHPAENVYVQNSLVHDVQGDGIVVFNAHRGSITGSATWHTGMQHAYSMGTPNAIWTWQCTDCTISNNEAFLADSPGVDGGAFDIDWGNTNNSVVDNFGHDTQGYCVSVFAANGPTTNSNVANNLCLANGLSPRLAQRQGAILLMTWSGGRLDGVSIVDNRVEWRPGGDTPAIQTGTELNASHVYIHGNEIHTTATIPIDPVLVIDTPIVSRRGSLPIQPNRYLLEDATPGDVQHVREQLAPADSRAEVAAEVDSPLYFAGTHAKGWELVATLPRFIDAEGAAQPIFLRMRVAAAEYAQAGLKLRVIAREDTQQIAQDWELPQAGASLEAGDGHLPISLKLVAPDGKTAVEWKHAPSAIELGLALRHALGEPVYGRLDIEQVRARD